MKKKKTIQITLVILTLLFLTFPLIQMNHRIIPVTKLKGVYHKQKLPIFTFEEWFSYGYQPKAHKYLLENYGFRPLFIRIYNQINFSLYQITHKNVTYGKEGFLFEHWFIKSYYGKNYIGDSTINSQVEKLNAVREYLQDQNKELMVVLAPGKANYWPEYIPEQDRSEKSISNYEGFKSALIENNIPTIDVNQWFKQAKDTTRIPLFPKTGTHWSTYGAIKAFDSIADYMAVTMQKTLPDMRISQVKKTKNLRDVDVDIEKLLNLFIPLNRLPLSYPKVAFQSDSNTFKPKAIVISDSFFWNIFNLGLQKSMFEHVKYWYYNNTVYPDSFKKNTTTKELDLNTQVKNTDVIVIMACPATIDKIGWGFIDRAYEELVLGRIDLAKKKEQYIIETIHAIQNSPKWLESVKNKSIEKNISLDSMIYLDAKWVANDRLKKEGLTQ